MAALPLPRGHRIERVAVVIPAHDEEDHLGQALLAVQRSADALHRVRPDVDTRVTVVLDSCTDGSAAITAGYAATDPRISALEVSYRSAGASRAAAWTESPSSSQPETGCRQWHSASVPPGMSEPSIRSNSPASSAGER